MRSLLAMSLAWKITLLTRSRYLKQKKREANVTAKTTLKWKYCRMVGLANDSQNNAVDIDLNKTYYNEDTSEGAEVMFAERYG